MRAAPLASLALLALVAPAVACQQSAEPESPAPSASTPPAKEQESAMHDEPAPEPATPPPTPRPPALSSLKEIEAALDRELTIVGEAAEAKLGAVVLIDGSAIYCLSQERWPDGVVGEQVEVTGTIRRTDRFRAEVLEEDAITQGTAGGDLVIEPCRFHLLTVD